MQEMREQFNLNVVDWSGTVLMTGFDTVATTIAYRIPGMEPIPGYKLTFRPCLPHKASLYLGG